MGWAQKKVAPDLLDLNRGLFYQRNHMEPFSGVAYEEYPNGQKKMYIPIEDGKIEGTAREWAPNGQMTLEVEYLNGVKEGVETQWFPQGGKRLEITYVNDQADGICYEWHRTGEKRSEGMYRKGKEEGEHRWYYDTGELDQVVQFRAGEPVGVAKTYYRNGKVKSEVEYQNGLMHGSRKEYFSNGDLRSEFTFAGGEEQGEAFIYAKDGRLLERSVYEQGKQIENNDYRSGSIRSEEGYYQVFNDREPPFQVHITGEEVVPRGREEIIYVVDGMFLQILTFPLDSLNTDEEKDARALLAAFVEEEADFISEATGSELKVETSYAENAQGVPFVHWHFPSPSRLTEEPNPRTVEEEHYFSYICGGQVLNLYGPVTRSDEPERVLNMLRRIGDEVKVESKPIDLNALVARIKK